MKLATPCLVASMLVVVPYPATATEDEHREHDAHVHGVSILNIAVEGNQMVAEFISPAVNIVGFEHAPENDEQRQAVQQAAADLERGGDWLALPEAANCRLAETGVESELLAEGSAGHEDAHDDEDDHAHADEHGHDEEDHGDEEGHGHDDEAAHEHEDGETHSEFHVSYEFTCGDASKIETVEVRLFEKFPGIEEIEFQAVSTAGQFGGELVPDDNVVRLTQ